MVKFSPRVGIDGRDMAAFNDPVVRRRFFRNISERCIHIGRSIDALQRKLTQNPQPFISLHREICQTWETLEGIRNRRLAVPEGVKHEVFTVKTLLEEILSKMGVTCSQPL